MTGCAWGMCGEHGCRAHMDGCRCWALLMCQLYQGVQVCALAGVLVYPVLLPSRCTGSASIRVALSIAARWQSSVSPSRCRCRCRAVATLRTAALPLISVHEHTACACCRVELPRIRAPCVNTVVKLWCREVSECGDTIRWHWETISCYRARDKSNAAPWKFISEVWGAVTCVVLFPESPQVRRERRQGKEE